MDAERRLNVLEIKVEKLTTDLSSTQKEFAAMRETVRIYVDMIDGLHKDLSEMRDSLVKHFHEEARDRVRLFAGIVTAALSGLSTLGVLIWGVVQVLRA